MRSHQDQGRQTASVVNISKQKTGLVQKDERSIPTLITSVLLAKSQKLHEVFLIMVYMLDFIIFYNAGIV